MRRIFWLALGLGAGAAVGVSATRFARRQAEKVAPANIAREARGGLVDLSKLVSDSLAEGRKAMARAERDARSTLEEQSEASSRSGGPSTIPPD